MKNKQYEHFDLFVCKSCDLSVFDSKLMLRKLGGQGCIISISSIRSSILHLCLNRLTKHFKRLRVAQPNGPNYHPCLELRCLV